MHNDPMRRVLRQRVQIHPDGSKEYWRDVPGFRDYYRVSDRGRVKSLTKVVRFGKKMRTIPGRLMRLRSSADGHQTVKLSKAGVGKVCFVHQLVLFAFVGPKPVGKQCRHLDGNGSNNRLDNICWGTPKRNSADRIFHGTQVNGDRVHCAKIGEADVPKIHAEYMAGDSCEIIARRRGVSSQAVKLVLADKTYKHCQPAVRAVMRPGGFKPGNYFGKQNK